ncbi:MAG: hypothetical protein K8T89_15245 [Planctomycetes bacterium]|nr:hypothetical protein [Planctomycetota bacterium]
MSNSPTPPAPLTPTPPAKPILQEVKIISHSMLFYWWPVWAFGFIFAMWTYADNYRLAIVSPESRIRNEVKDGRVSYRIDVEGNRDRLLSDAVRVKQEDPEVLVPGPRVSTRSWMGPVFFIILFVVILITNVPLRGLWSLITIFLIIMLALVFTIFNLWDSLLRSLGDLHIFMNMAGYLAISIALFAAWAVAVFVFDRRTYMIFRPGEVRLCEEVGAAEKVYGTVGMTFEKHRDDWFRHIVLGCIVWGTGDLTVRTAGGDRHEIKFPNVTNIGWKLKAIEQLLHTQKMA